MLEWHNPRKHMSMCSLRVTRKHRPEIPIPFCVTASASSRFKLRRLFHWSCLNSNYLVNDMKSLFQETKYGKSFFWYFALQNTNPTFKQEKQRKRLGWTRINVKMVRRTSESYWAKCCSMRESNLALLVSAEWTEYVQYNHLSTQRARVLTDQLTAGRKVEKPEGHTQRATPQQLHLGAVKLRWIIRTT